jgi:hypothetical protein
MIWRAFIGVLEVVASAAGAGGGVTGLSKVRIFASTITALRGRMPAGLKAEMMVERLSASLRRPCNA